MTGENSSLLTRVSPLVHELIMSFKFSVSHPGLNPLQTLLKPHDVLIQTGDIVTVGDIEQVFKHFPEQVLVHTSVGTLVGQPHSRVLVVVDFHVLAVYHEVYA